MRKAQPAPFEAKEVSGEIILYDAIGFQVSFTNPENLKAIAEAFRLAADYSDAMSENEEMSSQADSDRYEILRQEDRINQLETELNEFKDDHDEIKNLAGNAKTALHAALQSVEDVIKTL